ncbi:hypothetical protein D3C86_1738020 [compost metagenome]
MSNYQCAGRYSPITVSLFIFCLAIQAGCSSPPSKVSVLNPGIAPKLNPMTSFDVECPTGPTDRDGHQSICVKPICATAGLELIAQYTVKATKSKNTKGAEARCDLEFRDYRGGVRGTDIEDPLKVCITARVKSPGGSLNRGEHGYIKCTFSGYSYEPVMN